MSNLTLKTPRDRLGTFGVNLQGLKELLGLWLSETEVAKFWLSCLTDLKDRRVADIFVVCVDGLTGFPEAIRKQYLNGESAWKLVYLAIHEASKKWKMPVGGEGGVVPLRDCV